MSRAVSFRVRAASMGDYDALCPLFDELDEVHRQARPEMFQPFAPPARGRELVARWLADAGSTVLVAETDAGLVGLAVLLTRPASLFAGSVPRKVIEIDNLVVRADQRGQRIGRRLLSEAMSWARQRGASHVEVTVHDFNQDAERFYKAFGFARSMNRLMLVA
jgi:GNAT superfamily N-acetyltransferase